MSEQAKSILTRIHEYINSAAFKGNDEDRFTGNSAINHIVEGGIDKLEGLNEDQILSHVSNTSVTVEQKPKYGSLGGQLGMIVGLPSTAIEAGIRIKEKGFKRGLKETGEAYIGSRPYKLGESARLMTDILAPFGIVKTARVGKVSVKKIADIPRQARISHIGKTKARFKGEKYQHKYSGRVGSSSVPHQKNDLAAAYGRMVNAPKQWEGIKKKAAEVIKTVDPISKYTFTGLGRSVRKDIDNIITGKGSAKIKALRVDKLLNSHYQSGALKDTHIRAFNVYAADKLGSKYKMPLSESIAKDKISKPRIGKVVKSKKVTAMRANKVKVKSKPIPRTQPSAKPTPEQQVGSKAGSILEKVFNEKIKEFKAKSDIAFKKANPQLSELKMSEEKFRKAYKAGKYKHARKKTDYTKRQIQYTPKEI